MSKVICYVGNWWEADAGFWAKGGSSTIGVCACNYDEATGKLEPFQTITEDVCVGGQWLDPVRQVLYAVDEKLQAPGYVRGGGGAVYAYKINPADGSLTLLNKKSSLGVLTSYVTMDPQRQFLVVTNHTSHNYITKIVKDENGEFVPKVEFDDATVVLYEIEEDGSIGKACDIYIAKGTGPLEQQTVSHPHSVRFAPLGDFCLICDKGGDLVHTLKIDRVNKKFVLCGEPFHTEPGHMPRYSAFHPTKPFVYTNNEALPVIHCFKYDKDGHLDLIEVANGLSADVPFSGVPYSVKQSDICVSADGKYLYSAVRDVDYISVYTIDQETGKLTMIQCHKLDGRDPHAIAISPDGKFLLASVMKSHEVISLPINEDGTLGETAARIEQPSGCVITFDIIQ